MVIQVYAAIFEVEIKQSPMPVVLACIHPDVDRQPYQELLEDVAASSPHQVKVCLLQEDNGGVIGKHYGIVGTPTFLILNGGRVLARLLGETDLSGLTAFIAKNISS